MSEPISVCELLVSRFIFLANTLDTWEVGCGHLSSVHLARFCSLVFVRFPQIYNMKCAVSDSVGDRASWFRPPNECLRLQVEADANPRNNESGNGCMRVMNDKHMVS